MTHVTATYSFVLSETQVKKLQEWISKRPAVSPTAVGGRYAFEFIPTGIGDIVQVRDTVSKKKLNGTTSILDLTETENW